MVNIHYHVEKMLASQPVFFFHLSLSRIINFTRRVMPSEQRQGIYPLIITYHQLAILSFGGLTTFWFHFEHLRNFDRIQEFVLWTDFASVLIQIVDQLFDERVAGHGA